MGKQSEQGMKKYLLPVLFILLLIFPADASAGSKTRAQVLSYLTSLPSQSNKKVLSGQRTGFLNDSVNGHDNHGNDIFGDIATNSGGYVPAIMGGDIGYFRTISFGLGDGTYNLTRLINHWNAGGLVEVDWIDANPANGNVYAYPLTDPTIDLSTVYTPGNQNYDNFIIQLDHVAGALQQLQDNGVVVLFRPFMEMNVPEGAPLYNWWCGKDPTKFKNFWIYVHNYFTNTKGLTNLLWVYGALEYDWGNALDWYPGSAYVDIIGIDYYPMGVWTGDYDHVTYHSTYDLLKTTGKPFALTEMGLSPADASWDASGGKDSMNLINGVKAYYPDAVYWLSWDDQWELGRQSNLSSLFGDSWVVNRADNPSGTEMLPVGSGQSKKPSSPARVSIQ